MMNDIYKKINETQDVLARFGLPYFMIYSSIEKLPPGVCGVAKLSNTTIKISKDYLEHHPEHIFKVTIPRQLPNG